MVLIDGTIVATIDAMARCQPRNEIILSQQGGNWLMSRCRPVFVGMFVASILATWASGIAQDASVDCLYAGLNSSIPHDCSPDPYNIGSQDMVRRALRGIGVAPEQVVFRGCVQGGFSTSVASSRDRRFNIFYPLRPDYRLADYLGAIAHEIGHVSQLQQTGTIPELRLRLNDDSTRIELGADFMAGVLFRRHMRNFDQGSFEHSLDLIGNYRSGSLGGYSTSEARTAAFRMGFYRAGGPEDAGRLNDDFQRNVFAAIVREIARP